MLDAQCRTGLRRLTQVVSVYRLQDRRAKRIAERPMSTEYRTSRQPAAPTVV